LVGFHGWGGMVVVRKSLRLRKGTLYPGLLIRARAKSKILGGGFLGRSNRVVLLRKRDSRGFCDGSDDILDEKRKPSPSPAQSRFAQQEEDIMLVAVLRALANLMAAVEQVRRAAQTFENASLAISKGTTRAIEGNYHDRLNPELWKTLHQVFKSIETYKWFNREVEKQAALVAQKTEEYEEARLFFDRMVSLKPSTVEEDRLISNLSDEGRELYYNNLWAELERMRVDLDELKSLRADKAERALRAYEEVKRSVEDYEAAKRTFGLSALKKMEQTDIGELLRDIELSLKYISRHAQSISMDLSRVRALLFSIILNY